MKKTKAKRAKQSHIGANRPVCPASSQRQKLVEILEAHGVAVYGFDGLRSDAYERHLAGRSLTELDAFYERLLNPSKPYEKIREACLPWGKGSPYQGKLPSMMTLTHIRERIRIEARLERARQVPQLEHSAMLNAVQAYVMSDLMGLTEEGGKVIDHLPVVDRLIRAVSAKARVEQGEKRVELSGQNTRLKVKEVEVRQEELRLEQEKFAWFKAGQPITSPEPAPVVEDRIDEAVERVFGKDPYAGQPDEGEPPASMMLDSTNQKPDSNQVANEGAKEIRTSNDEIRKADKTTPAPGGARGGLGSRPNALPTEEEEVLPIMAYVRSDHRPVTGYPEGLGLCTITQQTVDMATKRYLSPWWKHYKKDLKRLNEVKKRKTES